MIRPSQRHFANENLDPRLRAGLVGHWIGGGSGLTWLDRSGYGRHGEISGATWTITPDASMACLRFDGVDDIVSAPHSDDYAFGNSGDVFSIALRLRTTQSATKAGLVCKGRPSAAVDLPWYLVCAAGVPTLARYNQTSGVYNAVASAVAVNDGKVHSLVALAEAANLHRIFVDGILVATDTSTWTTASNTEPLDIGRFRNDGINDNPFRGEIDYVRIYNRALSAAEINILAQPSFRPVVPRRWFVGLIPPTDATAAYATWVAPAATARLRLTTQATAAVSTWTVPSATARTRFTVPATAALSTWVAPSATTLLNRRRAISVSCSVASYSIPSSSSSYQIEVS